MDCPKCESKTSVLESRAYIGTQYRRRRCPNCGHTFWTSEEEANMDEVKAMKADSKAEQRRKKNAENHSV